MKRKKIGIFGFKLGESSFGMTLPYIRLFEYFGDVVILTPSSPIDTELDLLVVPGGPDINPSRYDASYIDYSVNRADPIREFFDEKHLPEYITHGVPVFGICRGFQSIAVLEGIPLVQNMYHETSIDVNKRGEMVHSLNIPYDFKTNMVGFFDNKDNINYRNLIDRPKLTNNTFKVNSLHHQSLVRDVKRIADRFEILASYLGKFDDAVEAIEHKTLPIAGVQWHPEELFISGNIDPISIYLINKLLNSKK
jgi:putative glutamine amidotransferase